MNVISLTKIRRTIVDEDEREVEETQPVTINTYLIRCITPRIGGKVGARLTFSDGRGFAVQEPREEVLDLLSACA